MFIGIFKLCEAILMKQIEFQSMEEDVGCEEVQSESSNQTTDKHAAAAQDKETADTELMQGDQEEETQDCGQSSQASQHQSTSSLTLKLNKLNCDSSSCSEEPKPGPSNSAADFDLEVNQLKFVNSFEHLCCQVFDSGSSCSNEECWDIDKKGSKVKVCSASPLTTTTSSVQNNKLQLTSQSSAKVTIVIREWVGNNIS